MFEYNSITLNPESEITIDLLNQMVLNDSANEKMRKIALEPPLAFALMDNNVGDPSTDPGANTSLKALYFAKNETTGITLNIDNVINSPLSIEVTVDRSGVYRFYVVAHISSGASDCVPSFQITDIDADVVQEIGGFIISGTQDSTAGNFYTPSILFVDRWLYGGKTYRFTVTTGLLGTNSDIAFINGYKAPPTISYFWVQGYNGTGQQIELPDFQVPSFSIDIPDIDITFPDFSFPDIEFPPFDFDFDIGGGFDFDLSPEFTFDPNFPFGGWGSWIESFDKGTGDGFGPDFNWTMMDWNWESQICPTGDEYIDTPSAPITGTKNDGAGIALGLTGTFFNNCAVNGRFHEGFVGGISDITMEVPENGTLYFSITIDCDMILSNPIWNSLMRFPMSINGNGIFPGTNTSWDNYAVVEYSTAWNGPLNPAATWYGHGPDTSGSWPVVGSEDILRVKFRVTSTNIVGCVFIDGNRVDGNGTLSDNGTFNVFWTYENSGSQGYGGSDPDFRIETITPGLWMREFHSRSFSNDDTDWIHTGNRILSMIIAYEEPWDVNDPQL